MMNFNNKNTRKMFSAIIIVVIVLAMVGGMVLAGLAM